MLEILYDPLTALQTFGGITLLMFMCSGTYCGPCKKLEPTLDEIAAKYKLQDASVRFVKTYDNAALDALNVTALPTLILFSQGHVCERYQGPINSETLLALQQFIDTLLSIIPIVH